MHPGSKGIWLVLVGALIGALLAGTAAFLLRERGAPSHAPVEPPQKAPAPASPAESPAVAQVEGGQFSGVDEKGRKQWEVRARVVSLDSSRERATLQNPTGILYREGRAVLRFRADQGHVDMQAREVELLGNVQMESAEGRRLRAQKVTWSEKAAKITASGEVFLSEGKLTVRADFLESDPDLTKTRLVGNVRVEQSE
ncbi:MAG: LPS export ABC transporter periplasmic protein LptC [Armatimonadota bacterium]|nr:LPS export ABC transporter periplasmic protein LptC [Armatimonadota bacterium]